MASIKKNYTYQLLYEVLAILLPIITAPYITRTLGAEKLGVYSYAVSIVNIFLSVARLGVVSHGSRSIAACLKDRERCSLVFWSIYTVQVICTLFVMLIYSVFVILFVKKNTLIYWILMLMMGSHLIDISWMYMGLENFKKTVIRNTIVKITSLVLIFVFIRNQADLWKYAFIMSGCIVLGHVTLWWDFKKHLNWYKPTGEEIRQQIKPMFVLFIPTIAVTIYTIISNIILGYMSGTTVVAFYDYAATIVSIPLGFITSFGAVMLPRLSNMIAGEAKEGEKSVLIERSLLFIVFLSAAMAFGLVAVAKELVPIYYGNEFLPCINLLVVMALKLPFMAWANIVRSTCLIPNNKDKQYIISLFLGAAISVAINLTCIPYLGAMGAVIASLAAEAVVCVAQTIFVKKEFSLLKTIVKSLPFLLCGGVMLVVVRGVASLFSGITILGLLAEIGVGVVIYLTLSGLYYSVVIEKTSPSHTLKKIFKRLFKSSKKQN